MASGDFRVLIIGAGNCGLALASGLKKIGVEYTIIERENEDDFINRPRDWGMLLHWGTEYLKNVLPPHLQDRMKEARVDPNYEMTQPIPYFDSDSGEIVKTVPTEVINRVSKRKLRRLLYEGAGLKIQFGKRLRSLNPGNDTIEAVFDDGSTAIGHLLVGADGSHSVVREFLVGKEAAQLEDTGLTMINFPYGGYTAEQARFLRSYHPIVQLGFSPESGGSLLAALDIPDPHETSDWKFQIYTSWWGQTSAVDLRDPQETMRFFKQRMGKVCEPFRTAALAVKEDEVLHVFPGHQWAPTMQWDNYGGKVTLAGDAAHSMLPHRGQGLNNAMKDASDIFDAVAEVVSGRKTLEKAISSYEEEMKRRGADEVALSYQTAVVSRGKDSIGESPMWKIGHDRPSD